MKIQIDINEDLSENEIVIRCKSLTREIEQIQRSVKEITGNNQKFVFYKDESEYYLRLDDILFFETEDNMTYAHTKNNIFTAKYKLYELEELLPTNFMRISKSSILNINEVFSIQRNITASSIVQLNGTHKKVYVSRHYFKPLKEKLDERRFSK